MAEVEAEYAVIRFIPDPARQEVFNIGIVAWNESGYVLRFDKHACAEVVSGTNILASTFEYLENEILMSLSACRVSEIGGNEVMGAFARLGVSQVQVGPHLLLRVNGKSYEDLARAVSGLMMRLVTRPPRSEKDTKSGKTEEIPGLDEGVAEAVGILRTAGINTYESCQGGVGHMEGTVGITQPFISFTGNHHDGFLALSLFLDNPHFRPAELRRVWRVIDGEPEGPTWKLVFFPLSS